ncbi:MAG: hypothetical protein Q4F31_05415 [Eubacteriales bacterium]|nr:hypothetical protein [Eubacteriales bacterium]
MFKYANGLSIASNADKDEVALSFVQSYPVFQNNVNPDGSITSVIAPATETAAEIIITKEFAREIVEMLEKSL